MESKANFDSGRTDPWAWTSGLDQGVEHIKKIGQGAFGEVHKV
jgi:hypothetical protein